MIVAAVLVAGGSGERLGAKVPKAFVEVGGATLLHHAIVRFANHPDVRDIVTVLPPGERGDHASATAVRGGRTRQQSVRAGLAAVTDDVEYVLIHDVARPFVPDDVITAVIHALRSGADAVIPVVPIPDTIRRVAADGALGETVERASLVAVQTPQGFRRDVLLQAHAAATGTDATDDASLVEALGVPVVSVPCADLSFKITTRADLLRAEAVVGGA